MARRAGDDRPGAAVRLGGLTPKERAIIVDREWTQDVHDEAMIDHIFQRVSGKKIRFTNPARRFFQEFRYAPGHGRPDAGLLPELHRETQSWTAYGRGWPRGLRGMNILWAL